MIGILVSFWDGLFAGAMLVSGRVDTVAESIFVKGQWAGMIAHQVHRWDTNSISNNQIVIVRHYIRRESNAVGCERNCQVHWESLSLSLCAQFKHLGPGTHGMEWFWANSCIFQQVFLVHTHERRLKTCNGLWRLPWFFPGQQARRRNRRENLEWVAAGWAASSGETQLLAAKRLPAPTRLCMGPWEALCTVEAYWDPQPEMKLST